MHLCPRVRSAGRPKREPASATNYSCQIVVGSRETMSRVSLAYSALLVTLLTVPSSSRAERILVEGTAVVTSIQDATPMFNSSVFVGQTISFSYSFNTTQPGSSDPYLVTSPGVGTYLAEVGDYTWSFDPKPGTGYSVFVGDNTLTGGGDLYGAGIGEGALGVETFGPFLGSSDPKPWNRIDMNLQDPSGTALTSSYVPTSIDLSDFSVRTFLLIRSDNEFGDPSLGETGRILGEVTSLTFTPQAVPEPGTMVALALGGAALLKGRKGRGRPDLT
ncbi:PEP-CTERM sorting domain-containing protein [bacterium]|nr:MAG: PEP-CTERM sorting domain-containing protein [bacterium]